MQLSKVHKQILFTLGSWYAEAEKKLEGRPLGFAISKSELIHALMKAGIAGKKERALYKNIELLERKKLVRYDNRCLELTAKGKKHFMAVVKDINPFVTVLKVLREKDILKSAKLQTKLVQ